MKAARSIFKPFDWGTLLGLVFHSVFRPNLLVGTAQWGHLHLLSVTTIQLHWIHYPENTGRHFVLVSAM